MVKIFLTGSNSELGKRLSFGLTKLGHQVVGASRSINSANFFDLRNHSVGLNLSTYDTVVHLALDRKCLNADDRHFNINGTANIAKLALKNKSTKFILISTESVHFPFSNYAITKRDSEKALLQLPICIIRIGTILDKNFKNSTLSIFREFPFKVFNNILVPSFMLKKRIFKISYISDIINFIDFETKKKSRNFKIITPIDDNYYLLSEVLKKYFGSQKIKVIAIPIDYFTIDLILKFLKFFSRRLNQISDSLKIYGGGETGFR
jgi:nucleoside-diphosphate-sugar epimerase